MRFSLIVCSYNPNPEWLANALKSARGFDEIILVDDGSIEPIVGATVRHEKNLGLYEAKNTGIRLATGDIICFLDDDDELVPEITEEMREFVRQSDGDIFSFHLQCFGDNNSTYGGGNNPDNLKQSNQFVGVSWFRKSVWTEVGGFTYPYAEDWEFWIKAHKAGKKFVFFPKIFYRYRVRKDSVSHSWGSALSEKIMQDMRKLCISL